jgi:hypothetical protein
MNAEIGDDLAALAVDDGYTASRIDDCDVAAGLMCAWAAAGVEADGDEFRCIVRAMTPEPDLVFGMLDDRVAGTYRSHDREALVQHGVDPVAGGRDGTNVSSRHDWSGEPT